MRYVRMGTIPKSVKSGWVLCHNHIMHTENMGCGTNGFRAWFEREMPPAGFIKCPCGWSGLPHYALREHVRAQKASAPLGTRFFEKCGATRQPRRGGFNNGVAL